MNKVSIKKIKQEDNKSLEKLVEIYKEVFEIGSSPIKTDYFTKLLDSDNVAFLVAEIDSVIVGGLTVCFLPIIHGHTEAYVYDIAVTSKHQRIGIGTKLLAALKIFCKANSIDTIFVQADIEDTDAINFYRKTGGTETDVKHFTYLL